MPFTHGLFSPPFEYTAQVQFGATSSGGGQATVRYWHPITLLKDVTGYISEVDNTDNNYKWAKFDSSYDGSTFEFSLIQNFDFSYKETSAPFTLSLGSVSGDVFSADEGVFTVWTDSAQSPAPVQITLDNSLPLPYTGLYLSMSVPANEAYNQTQNCIIGVKLV